jgi:hypothetical protein
MSGWPADPSQAAPAPFAVTAPPEVKLAGNRAGTTTFTVTNLTGRPVRARFMPHCRNGGDDSWVAIVGEAEVPMAVAATVTVDLTVTVPQTAPGGQYLLVLEVVAEDDTETVIGQSVTFTAPDLKGPVKKERHWVRLVLMIVGILLALIGLAALILIVAIVVGR